MHCDLHRHKYHQSVACTHRISTCGKKERKEKKITSCLEGGAGKVWEKNKYINLCTQASTGHLAGSFLRSRKWITAADVNTWDSECDAGNTGPQSLGTCES